MSYLDEMAEQGYHMDSIDSFHEVMVPWLLASQGVDRNATVIDIGAGHGHCLIPLHRSGWTRLLAVDIDDRNFTAFGDRFDIEGHRCDIATEPLPVVDASAGVILCFHLIEHLSSPSNLLAECARVLQPAGKLFLVTPDWRKQYRTFWRDPTHLRPYDKEAIARLLRMHGLQPELHSWGSRYGLGRLGAYRWSPRLGMIGADLLAVGTRQMNAATG
ncbi:MAG: class I SAM-dependent methyltransferase [Burkholderiales bacterium]|nr:class I SAM-dependent methyltransferase [Burkholderiales bacterium]